MEGLSSQESSPSSLSAARPERSPQRSSRGSSTITGQIRLKPKPSRSPGPRLDEVTSITPPGSDSFAEKQNGSALQPIDGGLAAWSYVVGAFAMYIVVWGNAVMVVLAKTAFAEDLGLGFPQAFPIFQAHLSTGPSADYPDSAIIRLLAPGIQDIEEGILFQLLPKANKHRRTLAIMGIAIITAAVFLASCSTSDWQVVLTQGVVFGVGGILLNFVHVSIFPEWFDRKKGQAMGIIWMGYRLGGLAFPPLCQWLLEKHGYAQCMRVLIAPMLALLLPSIVLLRGRYHSATVISQGPEPSVSKVQALRQPHVLFYLITVLLVDMVTNVPFMFIATFAADLQLSRADQALAFSLVQISNIIASYGSGWLSDQGFHEELLAGIALASSLVHFLLWGFCKSKFALFVYALATGLVGGGYFNCVFPFFGRVAGKNNELFAAVHSLFSFFGGFAILSIGPVGAKILQHSPPIDMEAYAIGKYKYLVCYTGGLYTASGTLILGRVLIRRFYASRISKSSPAQLDTQ